MLSATTEIVFQQRLTMLGLVAQYPAEASRNAEFRR
jgi:hypothetical protein